MATEELRIQVRLQDFATKEFAKLGSSVANFAKGSVGAFKGIIGSVFTLKNAILGSAASFAAYKALGVAADLEGIENAFRGLSAAAGGSEAVLKALRRGTRETVTDLNLMKQANQALLLGVADNAEEFENLSTTARRLGRALAIDTGVALEKLTVAIGRQSDLRLDDLGIIISVEEANKEYAASIGKTVEELTKAEKATAFLNSAMKAAESRVGTLGEDTLTLADEMGRAESEVLNLRDALLKGLTPALTDMTGAFADFIQRNRGDILRFFATVVEGAGETAQEIKNLYDVIRNPLSRGNTLEFLTAEVERLKAAIAEGIPGKSALEDTLNLLAATERELQEVAAKGSLRPIADSAREVADRIRDIATAAEFVGPKIEDAFVEFGPTLEQLGATAARMANNFRDIDLSSFTTLEERAAAGTATFEDLEILTARWVNELNRAGQEAEDLATALALLEDPLVGASVAFEELKEASDDWGTAAHDAVLDVADALSDNLTDGIMSLIDGTKSFKEAFRDTAKAILADIARIIVQTLILKAVQAGLGGIGGALAGLAQGGVVPGKLERVRGLAAGDVIHPPGGIFKVGEGRRSEAVLPLARTRSGDLGVQVAGGSGGGGMTQIINLTVNYNGSVTAEKDMLQRNAETIAALTVQKMRTSPSYREGMRAA